LEHQELGAVVGREESKERDEDERLKKKTKKPKRKKRKRDEHIFLKVSFLPGKKKTN